MSGRLWLGLTLLAIGYGTDLAAAAEHGEHFVGCPKGQLIRGIHLPSRTVDCVADGTAEIGALKGIIVALQAQLNAVLPFVSIDPNPINGLPGPHLIFTGVNVHVRSGSGATDDNGGTLSGLGNLIVGYNETPDGGSGIDQRLGSHNLVVGPQHTYNSYGGFVAGEHNFLTAPTATVTGGGFNRARGAGASILGGLANEASGLSSTVSGGSENVANGNGSSVTGGFHNIASGVLSTITGGSLNQTAGFVSVVCGGGENNATSSAAVICGGNNVTASRPAPPPQDTELVALESF